MKKLVGLCLLCLFEIVPSASAQYAGGDGDGYDRAGQRRSFPAYVNPYAYAAGGKGDGYDRAGQRRSFPAYVNYFVGGGGDGYDRAGQRRSFPAYINFFAGGEGDGYDSGRASLRVTRYVATTGSDASNDCTNPSNKCATLAHAVSQANAGDILDLAAGTYTEPGLVIDKALTIQGQGVIVQ